MISPKKLKKRKAVSTLSTTMTAKFFRERLRVKMSLMAMDMPIPRIGPIRGEISMAPMTTAALSASKPSPAMAAAAAVTGHFVDVRDWQEAES